MYIQSCTYMSYQGIYVGTGTMNGSPIKFQPAKMDISMWGMLYCQKCTKCIRLNFPMCNFCFQQVYNFTPYKRGEQSHGTAMGCNGLTCWSAMGV